MHRLFKLPATVDTEHVQRQSLIERQTIAKQLVAAKQHFFETIKIEVRTELQLEGYDNYVNNLYHSGV